MISVLNGSVYEDLDTFLDGLTSVDSTVFEQIRLMYRIDTLQDLAKKEAALRARHLKDEQNKSLLDKYSLTADEDETLVEFLQDLSGETFKCLSGWAKGINKAYQFNVTFDFEGTIGEKQVIVFYIKLPQTARFDMLRSVDDYITKSLKHGSVAEWFLLNNIPEFQIENELSTSYVDRFRSDMLHIVFPTRTFVYTPD